MTPEGEPGGPLSARPCGEEGSGAEEEVKMRRKVAATRGGSVTATFPVSQRGSGEACREQEKGPWMPLSLSERVEWSPCGGVGMGGRRPPEDMPSG